MFQSVTTLLVQLMVHWLRQGWNGTVSYNYFCLLLWSLNHHLRYIRKSLKLFKLSNKNRLSHTPIAYDVTNRKTFDALPYWYSELGKCISSSILRTFVRSKVGKVNTLLLLLHVLFDQANFVHILSSGIYFIRYRIPRKARVLSSSKLPQKIISPSLSEIYKYHWANLIYY